MVRKYECPKCGEMKIRTKHHVMPRRHYGKVGNNLIIYLCRQCHWKLEWHIPYEQMPDTFYVDVIRRFLDRYDLPLEGRNYVKDKQVDKSLPRKSKKERALLCPRWQKIHHK